MQGQTPVDRAGVLAARLAIMALVPGTFIYHTLAAFDIIPLFLGGWFGAMMGVSAAALVPLVAISTLTKRTVANHAVFGVLCVVVLLYALYFWRFGTEWQRSAEALQASAALLVSWGCFYGIGYFLRIDQGGWIWPAIAAVWGGMVLLVLLLMDDRSLSFDLQLRFGNPHLADYKVLANFLMFAALLSLAWIKNRVFQGVMLGISIIVLYVMTSRAEMIAMMAVWAAWGIRLLYKGERKAIGASLAATLVLAGVLGGVRVYHELSPTTLGGTSVYQTSGSTGMEARADVRRDELLDLAHSQSFSMRMTLLGKGLEDIASSPFFGDYAGQIADGSIWGDYIHSDLGVWRQFGLVAFLLYVYLTYRPPFTSARKWWRSSGREWHLLWYLSLPVMLLCTFANSAFWYLPAVVWGLAADLRERA